MGVSSDKWVHRLTDLDVEAQTAVCAGCGPVRVRKKPSMRSWRCANAMKAERKRGGREPHGLTRREAQAFRTGKACAACGATEGLCVDHCHETGRIRGVLCRACNRAAGMLGDDPARVERLAAYLRGELAD